MQATYGPNELKNLLSKVKIFKKEIGDYQLYAITNDFDYTVKLSNGTISFKIEDLQDDENDALTPERLMEIASRFKSKEQSAVVSNDTDKAIIQTPVAETIIVETPVVESVKPIAPTSPVVEAEKVQAKKVESVPQQTNKSNLNLFVIFGLVGAAALLIYFMSKGGDSESLSDNSTSSNQQQTEYNSDESYNDNNAEQYSGGSQSATTTSSQPRQKTEDELRQELYNKEARNPKDYLSASYTYRVNLAANTIVEGEIYNSASMAGFKNVKMTVNFYSKTDVLLGKETFTVMDFVPPGESVSFRYKISGWWENVAASRYTLISAEAY